MRVFGFSVALTLGLSCAKVMQQTDAGPDPGGGGTGGARADAGAIDRPGPPQTNAALADSRAPPEDAACAARSVEAE